MASIIQLKTGTGSAVPTSLAQGEVAINIDNGLFYFGSGSGEDVKSLESFTNITASGNISASGNITASGLMMPQLGTIEWLSAAGGKQVIKGTDNYINIDGDNFVNVIADQGILLDAHVTASGNISASGNIIGSTGSFAQTVITLKSGVEDSPFLIKIANSNGQDNKLEVTKDGVLKFGALNTLPTAITGGLVYSSSAFYMGI
jgi:hypothetical protein